MEWEIGDTAAVCESCGTKQPMEKSDIYAQAGLIAAEDSEESLEQAMLLYHFIRGWHDADQQYMHCRTRLGQLRWQTESARLKAYENNFEGKVARWKKAGFAVLAAVLLCIAVVVTISLVRLRQYNKAAEYFTAGEYERSAEAFLEMGSYQDSRARLFLSAVELYRAKRYETALHYFIILDGYIDNGYYLQKCQERLAAQRDAAP